MKVLTIQECEGLAFKSFTGPGRTKLNQAVRDELDKLAVGQMLLIEVVDWKGKSAPSTALSTYFRDKKFSSRTLVNGGWVTTRKS